MWGHEPQDDEALAPIFERPRGGLTATWRILAALFALMALIAPAGAQTPTSDSAQATLSLSAVLKGGSAPLTGGLRWRVFGAQADPDGSHPLIVESGLAQPTLTIPPGRLCRSCRFRARERGQTRDARRGSPLRTPDPLGGRAPDRRHARRRADRPFQAVARHLRAAEPQSAGQARLRQRQGRRYHRTAGRLLSHRLDLSRHGRRPLGGERGQQFRQIGGSRAACGDPVQFDRQRRHQGHLRQADRRHDPSPLRDAHAQARQQAGGPRRLPTPPSRCSPRAATSSAS